MEFCEKGFFEIQDRTSTSVTPYLAQECRQFLRGEIP